MLKQIYISKPKRRSRQTRAALFQLQFFSPASPDQTGCAIASPISQLAFILVGTSRHRRIPFCLFFCAFPVCSLFGLSGPFRGLISTPSLLPPPAPFDSSRRHFLYNGEYFCRSDIEVQTLSSSQPAGDPALLPSSCQENPNCDSGFPSRSLTFIADCLLTLGPISPHAIMFSLPQNLPHTAGSVPAHVRGFGDRCCV